MWFDQRGKRVSKFSAQVLKPFWKFYISSGRKIKWELKLDPNHHHSVTWLWSRRGDMIDTSYDSMRQAGLSSANLVRVGPQYNMYMYRVETQLDCYTCLVFAPSMLRSPEFLFEFQSLLRNKKKAEMENFSFFFACVYQDYSRMELCYACHLIYFWFILNCARIQSSSQMPRLWPQPDLCLTVSSAKAPARPLSCWNPRPRNSLCWTASTAVPWPVSLYTLSTVNSYQAIIFPHSAVYFFMTFIQT